MTRSEQGKMAGMKFWEFAETAHITRDAQTLFKTLGLSGSFVQNCQGGISR
jgi:hypothetical protein